MGRVIIVKQIIKGSFMVTCIKHQVELLIELRVVDKQFKIVGEHFIRRFVKIIILDSF